MPNHVRPPPAKADPEVRPALVETRVPLPDLVLGEFLAKLWQHESHSADNMLWQGAPQRRRMHMHRSNVQLGVANVELSGPHEVTHARAILFIKTGRDISLS